MGNCFYTLYTFTYNTINTAFIAPLLNYPLDLRKLTRGFDVIHIVETHLLLITCCYRFLKLNRIRKVIQSHLNVGGDNV